jgi:hypothetical protein
MICSRLGTRRVILAFSRLWAFHRFDGKVHAPTPSGYRKPLGGCAKVLDLPFFD